MTIKDIAALAGVSTTTVSMVLNNKADSISEETRERVLRVVRENNFRPYGRTIQNSAVPSGLVGLVIPGSADEFSDLVAGAQEAAEDKGYNMILCSIRSERELAKQLGSLFSKGVDGIGLYLSRERDLEQHFVDAPEKLVYTAVSNRQAAAWQCTAYCAFSDATRQAMEHLMENGHRQIALIGWKDHFLAEELTTGYTEALYSHDITLRSGAICLCREPEEIADAVRQIMFGDATAILCQDTQIAGCVYRTLGRYGAHIPKDYSVMSVSADVAPLAAFDPELTRMDLQRKELGQAVMEDLIARIEGSAKASQEPRLLQPQLRAGGSVIPPKTVRKRIVVVGSINMDVIISMPHIPTSGESLLSQRILNLSGGKGANQAVGAAKLGGDVSIIGCLGEDQEGRMLFKSMTDSGVNTAGIQIVPNLPTGKAYILVAENGDSTIVRAKGANETMTPEVVEKNSALFRGAELCLLSTEIPWETVLRTLDLCRENGVKVILKPTIQQHIPPEILKKVTYLIPNEIELEVQASGKRTAEEKADALLEDGAEAVIVTLGEKGCYLHTKSEKRHFPAADFKAVDTTGAGDAFISAFAVYLSEGHTVEEAIRFATYAAGISVTRDGVQPALADRMAVEIYSDQYSLG